MNKKGFASIIIILAILIFGGVGYAVYTEKIRIPGVEKREVNQENANQPTLTPTPDETVRWKTYRNEKYGFEFKYPENWKAPTVKNWKNLEEFSREGKSCSQNQSLAELLKLCLMYKDAAEEEVNGNIFYAIQTVWNEMGASNKVVYLYFANKGQVYSIVFQGLNNVLDLTSEKTKILSTFKFIDIKSEKPSITIIYPNGGESFETEKTHTIKWNSTGLPSSAKIWLFYKPINQRLDFPALETGSIKITTTSNTGSFEWKTPKTLGGYMGSISGELRCPSENDQISTRPYYLEILVENSDGSFTIFDRSNTSFNLTGSCAFEGY
ncbi:MAG: hypothetical protein UW30_C0006G0006 [Candidatus Giovannonibacteria bacterium GW2011_GWA2_44_13b]|uniref:Uncharacterized protein n=2 Tax=Candidatus Giovannoniibacteriota TaxID=1752738 RepID=A0A0G1K1B0_9BACT|nr:MAG: hypothetical protein UW30_C0006G0006 [Candidatus Giovannonibacteria bacterium GW2011_GWA2_44_13b]OGF82964.1 MAG: hypothetical protein A2924_04405 [Candidatus Giovannonibacteria bacterium RIFCSPLOWO2_01_FULL_44_16]